MENRKTLKVILIGIVIYMLLSWFIVAGNFVNGSFTTSGFNQVGLFDILLAPINTFNTFVVSMSQSVNGAVNTFAYGNIIVAFIAIGIYYGVLNRTDAYYNLVIKIRNKLVNKRGLFLIIVAALYYLISAFTGLYLILFMFFPFICSILSKLKYNKITIFFTTIGSMLIGGLGSIFNPSINGINRVLFGDTSNLLVPRIVLSTVLLIVVLATILLSDNKDSDKIEATLLLEEKDIKKLKKQSYVPIIVISSIVTIILFICMYNWYYMFGSTTLSSTYNTITSYGIKDYKFMNNILGMTETFGYWTGFTMSGLLLVASLVTGFIYKIKFDDLLDGCKKNIRRLVPVIFYSIVSLSIIVISLNGSDSFLYSIINNIFSIPNQIISILLSSILHNIFINDYFALLSLLGNQYVSLFGQDSINISLLITQVGHGIASLITPFNIYLIAGLTYLGISYTSWIKYIWKILLVIITISLFILFVTVQFM